MGLVYFLLAVLFIGIVAFICTAHYYRQMELKR